ncbi:N-acetylmuramoyl-L-alanine amidase, partial [Streptomyces filamentosus]
MPRPASRGRVLSVAASAALLLPLLSGAPPAGADVPAADSLQRLFASAAERHGVPQSVLLAVSYLQSRWDGHAGAPSVTGGYGPMHLTDAATALARSAPTHARVPGPTPRPPPSTPGDVMQISQLPYAD